MKILFCGDIVGRAGRKVVLENIPRLRQELALDFVIVNGENAAGGFGITPAICEEFYHAGVDVITSGNHIYDQTQIIEALDHDPRLLRPMNYPQEKPGQGVFKGKDAQGRGIVVINISARLFMPGPSIDDPFSTLDHMLLSYPLKNRAIIVDIHGEANSEKMGLAHFVDGRVSLVVGTHTHIPTADAQILDGGTAYQTDAGMCGDYNSVIGMRKEGAVARLTGAEPKAPLVPAMGEPTICGVYLETDDETGLAIKVSPLRLGGRLTPHWPI